tara:strand:- start:1961 stop:2230 length:270 start_codon:yes stop_codon:yes gene_type:complete
MGKKKKKDYKKPIGVIEVVNITRYKRKITKLEPAGLIFDKKMNIYRTISPKSSNYGKNANENDQETSESQEEVSTSGSLQEREDSLSSI